MHPDVITCAKFRLDRVKFCYFAYTYIFRRLYKHLTTTTVVIVDDHGFQSQVS